jgi:NTP pyrophosphatase (non-canonical NTP hydrolase)
MTSDNLKECLLFFCKNYGVRHQIKRAQSEIFEFNEAVINYENARDSEYTQDFDKLRDAVAEEFADVLTMLGQIVLSYDICEEDILRHMRAKADRQLKRIENNEIDRI